MSSLSIPRFTTKRVSELSGVAKNRLQLWVFKGIIKPTVKSPGHGKASQYSFDDVVCVTLIDALYRVGLPLKKCGKVSREICTLYDADQVKFEDGRIILNVDVAGYRSDVIKRYEKG